MLNSDYFSNSVDPESLQTTWEESVWKISMNQEAGDSSSLTNEEVIDAMNTFLQPFVKGSGVNVGLIEDSLDINSVEDLVNLKRVTKQIFEIASGLGGFKDVSLETNKLNIKIMLETAFYLNIKGAEAAKDALNLINPVSNPNLYNSISRMRTHFYAHAATNAEQLSFYVTNSRRTSKGNNNIWLREQNKYIEYSIESAEEAKDYVDLLQHYISATFFYRKRIDEVLNYALDDKNKAKLDQRIIENIAMIMSNWRDSTNKSFYILDRFKLRFSHDDYVKQYNLVLDIFQVTFDRAFNVTTVIQDLSNKMTMIFRANKKDAKKILNSLQDNMPEIAFTLLQYPLRLDMFRVLHGQDEAISEFFLGLNEVLPSYEAMITNYYEGDLKKSDMAIEITSLVDLLYLELNIKYQSQLGNPIRKDASLEEKDLWRRKINEFALNSDEFKFDYIFKLHKIITGKSY